MKITKLTPRGFCKGVVDAWVLAKNTRKQNPNKKIIMIGQLVHNQDLINDIKKDKIDIIDDSSLNRLEIITNLKEDNKNTILIFSAHGTDDAAINLARERGYEVVDATCEYVTKTKNIIKRKIKDGYQIIFIGKHNHPETNAMLAIDKNIIFIQSIEDAKQIQFSNKVKYFLTNQTTISIYDFYDIIKYLKTKVNYLKCENEICTATIERQEAVINMDKTIDILIVVGDQKSNNSNKLVEIAKSKNVEAYLIQNKSMIKNEWFNNKKHIAITSGASTPTWITNDVIKTIEERWGKNEKGKHN